MSEALSGALGGSAAGALLNLASNLGLGPWAWGLQQASWRSLPFVVKQSTIKRGRRVVVHEYPDRDEVWVEDLGRGTRVVSFTGYVLGDNVFAQRNALAAAAETAGTGVLVHPSLGRMNATLTEFSASERFDLGRVVEINFSFIQSATAPAFPTSTIATQLATAIAAVQAGLATVSDYTSAITTAISGINSALTFASNIFATVTGAVGGFVGLAGSVINDAGAAAAAVLGLQGNYGRYQVGTNIVAQPATATVASVLAAVTVARAAALAAGATLSATVDPSLLPAAAQALTEAVRAVAQDPADQIRILSALATYTPTAPLPSFAPIGATIAAMTALTTWVMQAAALISIANATTIYQPTSYNDAVATLRSVTVLFNAGILAAADQGLTASYLALRALRAAVTADLLGRAATLPRLMTVTSAIPRPSLALAYALYGDATRSDQLVSMANPISPLFMPLSFQALSS
jgi:prophage DNA circulation protein